MYKMDEQIIIVGAALFWVCCDLKIIYGPAPNNGSCFANEFII